MSARQPSVRPLSDRPLSAHSVSVRDVPARHHHGPFGLPAVWTDDKVERLRALWSDATYSAAAIARLLGGVSRSAVLGKVRRLGLESRAGMPALRRERTPGEVVLFRSGAKGGGTRETGAPPRRAAARSGALVPFRRVTIEEWLAPRTQEFQDLPVEHSPFAVTLDALTPRHCRWPLGDPASSDFRFCGDQAAVPRSYCARHCAMAYRPAPERSADKQGQQRPRVSP